MLEFSPKRVLTVGSSILLPVILGVASRAIPPANISQIDALPPIPPAAAAPLPKHFIGPPHSIENTTTSTPNPSSTPFIVERTTVPTPSTQPFISKELDNIEVNAEDMLKEKCVVRDIVMVQNIFGDTPVAKQTFNLPERKEVVLGKSEKGEKNVLTAFGAGSLSIDTHDSSYWLYLEPGTFIVRNYEWNADHTKITSTALMILVQPSDDLRSTQFDLTINCHDPDDLPPKIPLTK